MRSRIHGLILACTLLHVPAIAQEQSSSLLFRLSEPLNQPQNPSAEKPSPPQSPAPPPAGQAQATLPMPSTPMRLTLQAAVGHSYVSYDHVGFVAPKTFQSFRCRYSFADLVSGVG